MFHSEHPEGSAAWYEDLEASLIDAGVAATSENILIAREKIMIHTGRFIPDDYRFLKDLAGKNPNAARKAS